jgi:hypothetical protein
MYVTPLRRRLPHRSSSIISKIKSSFLLSVASNNERHNRSSCVQKSPETVVSPDHWRSTFFDEAVIRNIRVDPFRVGRSVTSPSSVCTDPENFRKGEAIWSASIFLLLRDGQLFWSMGRFLLVADTVSCSVLSLLR